MWELCDPTQWATFWIEGIPSYFRSAPSDLIDLFATQQTQKYSKIPHEIPNKNSDNKIIMSRIASSTGLALVDFARATVSYEWSHLIDKNRMDLRTTIFRSIPR